MGKDLHYLILEFFKERMRGHNKVSTFGVLSLKEEIIYRIKRVDGLSEVIVHLSDDYAYTLHSYYSKPSQLSNGGFILVAKPEANFDPDIIPLARSDRIGLGGIGKLLGALNHERYWLYEEPIDDLRKRV